MKFLHTADLHIGKTLGNFSLIEDQKFALQQIIEIAVSEKVDAIFIAGDVYQRATPSAEAMALFNEFVTSLVNNNIKIVMISGNHDAEQRIAYFSQLIQKAGVYAAEEFDGELQKVELSDEYGRLNIYMLPYVHPARIRQLTGAKVSDYNSAVKTVLDSTAIDTCERNILVCHQFVLGAETCDSEEHSVGGLENLSADIFRDFDYVALGHIHKPQWFTRETLRYSGSPLKYSFSEATHNKSVTIVDCRGKGDIQLKSVSIKPKHDVRMVRGKFDEIMRLPSEDYVWVTLTDELVIPDASSNLIQILPNMVHFSVDNLHTKYDEDIKAAEKIRTESPLELFTDFYKLMNSNCEPSEEHVNEIKRILDTLSAEADNEAD